MLFVDLSEIMVPKTPVPLKLLKTVEALVFLK